MATSIELPARLEQRVSKANGKPYICVIVKLNENVEKMFFLTDSDAEVVRLSYSNSGNSQKLKVSGSGNT